MRRSINHSLFLRCILSCIFISFLAFHTVTFPHQTASCFGGPVTYIFQDTASFLLYQYIRKPFHGLNVH